MRQRVTVESSLEEVIIRKQKSLRKAMRTISPFLTNEALDKMLVNASNAIREGMQHQAHVIAGSKARFDFFSIPAELRNEIYSEVVCGGGVLQQVAITHGIEHEEDSTTYGDDRNLYAKPSPITQVCRQMREETLPMYYGQSAFVAYVDIDRQSESTRTSRLHEWLQIIGPQSARLVKDLIIKIPLPESSCMWTGTCNDYSCDKFQPDDSKEVGEYLHLYRFGVRESAVRALFGAHRRRNERWADGPYRGDKWQHTEYSSDLDDLWWTPVPGERCRKFDNYDLDTDDEDEDEEVEEEPFDDDA